MPGRKPLAQPCNVIYLYDGSFEGFLCLVHESVYTGELPEDIFLQGDIPISFMPVREIITDSEKAQKVLHSVSSKISQRALNLIQTVFLSCLKQKELLMLRFLLKAYRQGAKLLYMFGDADLAPLLSAERHLRREQELLTGFIRFSDYNGTLVSTITPKNFILPFLARHFLARYREDDFMIFDKTHGAALIYEKGKGKIISVESVAFSDASPEEERYRSLWKQFYNTVAIPARYNPKCRMTHMPKRYWENMLEVQDLLS